MRSASPVHQISSAPAPEVAGSELFIFFPRFKISFAHFAISICFCILFFSCDSPKTETGKTETEPVPVKTETKTVSKIPTVKTPIGSSGFSVELPASHKIETQQNAGFTIVYFITPTDTVAHPGEAGMYFGPTPDVKPPKAEYTIQEIDTVFLGKKQKWIEYTTALYVQRETFIDENNGQYIHFWCYSNSKDELDNLFRMMLSITR